MNMLLLTGIGALLALFSGTATPEASDPFPFTPMAEYCQTEPMAIDALIAIVAEEPSATPEAIPDTAGTPVDEATRAEIEAALVRLVGCQNSGEPLRVYQLYTDNYLRYLFHGFDESSLTSLATPAPLKTDQWITIVTVDDIRLLADGRVYATVIINPALIPVDKIFGFILVDQDGTWLVDDILDELRFSLP